MVFMVIPVPNVVSVLITLINFCRECGDKLKPLTKYEQFREVMADTTPSQIAELLHLLAGFGRDYQQYLNAPYPKENQHDFILRWLKDGD